MEFNHADGKKVKKNTQPECIKGVWSQSTRVHLILEYLIHINCLRLTHACLDVRSRGSLVNISRTNK